MKNTKKIINILTIFIFIIFTLLNINNKSVACINTETVNNPLRISVLFSDAEIALWQSISEYWKQIEKETGGQVIFTIYDGKVNEDHQENQLNDILINKKADVLIYNIVDVTRTKNVIDKTKKFNIPIIFANNGDLAAINTYEKAYLAAPDPRNIGTLVGNIVVDAWKKYKKSIDINHNNTLEYVMLQGTPNSLYSTITSKTAIEVINNNHINTLELANKYCNWDEKIATVAIRQMFLGFGTKIEGIITVDDGLAIGAVKALQEYGYNLEDKKKKIMVVGVAGLPEALDMIKKGYMTGTATMNIYQVAKDFYTFALNLSTGKNIIDGTDCTIDNTGKILIIPFTGVYVNLDQFFSLPQSIVFITSINKGD